MTPIYFQWDGEVLKPASAYWAKRADEEYVVGEKYKIAPIEDRSMNSHRHYFACVHEAWSNLRDADAERFATSEHLRKWVLIKTGYHDERSIVCASKAEAQRLAAFIKPMDDFAIVVVREATVTVYTAKSQAIRAMGNKTFQKSKTDVLEYLSAMIGVKIDDLKQQAGPMTDAAGQPVSPYA